jgi:hypothetical protein
MYIYFFMYVTVMYLSRNYLACRNAIKGPDRYKDTHVYEYVVMQERDALPRFVLKHQSAFPTRARNVVNRNYQHVNNFNES